MTTVVRRGLLLLVAGTSLSLGGERSVLSMKDLHDVELKSAGFTLSQPVTIHIRATGGGGDGGWMHKYERMFAYGWIINADTRRLVWRMSADNTSREKDDRTFDGVITLQPGSYEAYFTAYAFSFHTAFTNIDINIDHREKPLFPSGDEKKKGFMSWLRGFWSDDAGKEWDKRSRNWGMEFLVDESVVSAVTMFDAPKRRPNTVLSATGLGDLQLVRDGFTLTDDATLSIDALGEESNDGEMADYGWIVSASDRKRVWEMTASNTSPAGGASKNVECRDEVTLPRGSYVLYFITDGTHSCADWNAEPPNDPLNWGITISVPSEKEKKSFKPFNYDEDKNLIVGITKVRDNEYRTEGFTLKSPARVRIYAFGERNNSRRSMADYAYIMDAKSRNKIWTMDVDRSYHGGGGSKNRFFDEVISLPAGSYVASYQTDDSHAYDEWNVDPPFDPERYGISILGAGEKFDPGIVGKYVEARDKNLIAQIVRVGDNADRSESFTLQRTTRVRIYAIGEGRDREMYDYGWIEDAKSGSVIWEMTYNMTFYAGGGRKNRLVNTTILLDKGTYRLRWRSDDSHSYGSWNVDPPDDQQYWGITLYKDEGPERPPVPAPPPTPEPPDDGE